MRITQIIENIEPNEVTYDDDDMFFEDYGVMYWNDDDDPIDEAEYQGWVKLGVPTKVVNIETGEILEFADIINTKLKTLE